MKEQLHIIAYISGNHKYFQSSKLNVNPTKSKLSIGIKIDDIIFPGSLADGDAICYISAIKTLG
jgi:hypothetical protein